MTRRLPGAHRSGDCEAALRSTRQASAQRRPGPLICEVLVRHGPAHAQPQARPPGLQTLAAAAAMRLWQLGVIGSVFMTDGTESVRCPRSLTRKNHQEIGGA